LRRLEEPPEDIPVCVMGIDGSGGTTLTSLGYNSNPSWSPDGTRIAFESDQAGKRTEIYVMSADGSHQMEITPGINGHAPAWSPVPRAPRE